MPGDDNTNGTTTETQWYTPEQASHVTAKGWKGPQDAVTAAINAESMIGLDRAGRLITRPKDEKDAEGLAAYRKGIGVPEKAEDYGVPDPLKDDPVWPIATKLAHQHGLPKDAFVGFTTAIMAEVNRMSAEKEEAADVERKQNLAKLETAWGADAVKNGEFAKRAVAHFTKGFDEESVKMFSAAVENDARFRQIFAQVGALMGEHGFSGGDTTGAATADTQKKLDELRQQRIEGKITEAEWTQQVSELLKAA